MIPTETKLESMHESKTRFLDAALHADPLDRLLAYVDFRDALLSGELPDFTCPAETMAQEVYDAHPAPREACNRSIREHAATLVPDIEEAKRQHGIEAERTAESLALYMQATIQRSSILAKAKNSREVAAACIEHLRRYFELLFHRPQANKVKTICLAQ